MLLSVLFGSLPILVSALYMPESHDGHNHVQRGALPKRWYQEESHPVHQLFRRATDDGNDYPAVGTPTWSAPFPRTSPDPQALPAEWKDALDAAVAADKIPAIPQSSSLRPQTNPVYPAGINPSSPEVCSATYKCRHADVIWNVPEGVFGSSFDDGPYPSSGRLIEFLTSQNASTTHFMIGVHILNNPSEFLAAFEADNDIAVHTWNHPYMTTLSNVDIVGQLGWTMQLIHHSTGGRVPRYWRPPYGDSDNRVQAIAWEVFGLETVIWNLDTNDWELASGLQTEQEMHHQIEQWLDGPKTDGIMMLQHEVTDLSVKIFMDIFPLIEQKGWRYESLAQVLGDGMAYQNAASSSSDDVTAMNVSDGPSGGDDSDDEDDGDEDSTASESATESSSETSTRTGGLSPTPTMNSPVSQSSAAPDNSAASPALSSSWHVMALLCLSSLLL